MRISHVFRKVSSCFSESVGLNDAFDYYKSANYAFTLAEVLITIGVIGIVAAIAIPSLINHYNDKVLETRYQRSKNILVNGYKLMMSKEQVFDIKDLSVMKCTQYQDMIPVINIDCVINAHKEVFKIARDNSSPDISEAFGEEYTIPVDGSKMEFAGVTGRVPVFQTTDGMSYMVGPQYDYILIDTDLNGKSGPNTFGKDMFEFMVSGNGLLTDMTDHYLPEPPEPEPEPAVCSVTSYEACMAREECEALNNGYSGEGCFYWNGHYCTHPSSSSEYCR